MPLSAPDKIDNFDLISRLHECCIEMRSFEHYEVVFDGDSSGVNLELVQETVNSERLGKFEGIAV